MPINQRIIWEEGDTTVTTSTPPTKRSKSTQPRSTKDPALLAQTNGSEPEKQRPKN